MHRSGASGAGPFHEYGVEAAPRPRSTDAGVDRARRRQFVGRRRDRPATAARATWPLARSPRRWAGTGARMRVVLRRLRLGRHRPRRRPLPDPRAASCDVALVVGADTTPKGFLAPVAGSGWDDPDWLRFRLLGATNPTYFALYARRRMDLYGATDADFAKVKVKNAKHGLHNPYARYRKEVTEEEVLASPMVADPLRLLEICATSDGAAAGGAGTSMDYAKRQGIRRRRCGSGPCPPMTPAVPEHGDRDAATSPRTPPPRCSAGPRRSGTRSRPAATRSRASAPRTSAWPRSTTSPPPSSSTGTRTWASARRARRSACSTTRGPRLHFCSLLSSAFSFRPFRSAVA